MKLYGGLLSPFVMRVALAARAKGLTFETRMPEGGLKDAAYLAINPFGKMPALVDGDVALFESEVINEYLDDAHPRPSLRPEGPAQRARMRLLSRIVDLYLIASIVPFFRPDATDADKQGALTGITNALKAIEHVRHGGDKRAIGQDFTLADCSMIPAFFFLDAFQPMGGTADCLASAPQTAAWWERAKTSAEGHYAVGEMGAALQAFMAARKSG